MQIQWLPTPFPFLHAKEQKKSMTWVSESPFPHANFAKDEEVRGKGVMCICYHWFRQGEIVLIVLVYARIYLICTKIRFSVPHIIVCHPLSSSLWRTSMSVPRDHPYSLIIPPLSICTEDRRRNSHRWFGLYPWSRFVGDWLKGEQELGTSESEYSTNTAPIRTSLNCSIIPQTLTYSVNCLYTSSDFFFLYRVCGLSRPPFTAVSKFYESSEL